MKKLIGYKRFISKSGIELCIAQLIKEYSQRDIDNGCCGHCVEEVFLPNSQVDYLIPEDIGKEVELNYTINGNRAFLDEIVVLGR